MLEDVFKGDNIINTPTVSIIDVIVSVLGTKRHKAPLTQCIQMI